MDVADQTDDYAYYLKRAQASILLAFRVQLTVGLFKLVNHGIQLSYNANVELAVVHVTEAFQRPNTFFEVTFVHDNFLNPGEIAQPHKQKPEGASPT